MTLRPYFDVVTTEMVRVEPPQSDEIAALGFENGFLIVQFHRLPGLFGTPAAHFQFELLLEAEVITTIFTAKISEDVPPHEPRDWHLLDPYPQR